MQPEFYESLFICWIVGMILVVILLICNAIGLGIMRLRDMRTGRRKWYVTGKVCR